MSSNTFWYGPTRMEIKRGLVVGIHEFVWPDWPQFHALVEQEKERILGLVDKKEFEGQLHKLYSTIRDRLPNAAPALGVRLDTRVFLDWQDMRRQWRSRLEAEQIAD